MTQKLALKRLTASDLTLFEWHYKNRPAGNQKAINLNADVFVGELFPAIDAAARATAGKLPLDLWISGPAGADYINLQRKIIKGGAYKNWRLDGEFIVNPVSEPDRFNSLEPEDFAVFAFDGEIVPTTATVVFVARSLVNDAPIHAALERFALSGRRTMIALSDAQLADVIATARLPEDHPLAALMLTEELEEAAEGSAKATEKLLRSRRSFRLSSADLRKARDAAEETGRIGEALVEVYLQKLKAAGQIDGFEWVSETNAVAPMDFTVVRSGTTERIDVKSTTGPFKRDIHVSVPELREMATSRGPYFIFRVYDVSPDGANLRISSDISSFSTKILKTLDTMPVGVTADSVSIEPERLSFPGAVIRLEPADDETSET